MFLFSESVFRHRANKADIWLGLVRKILTRSHDLGAVTSQLRKGTSTMDPQLPPRLRLLQWTVSSAHHSELLLTDGRHPAGFQVVYFYLLFSISPREKRHTQDTYTCGFMHCESGTVVSDSLWHRELYSPWTSPGQNTGVGSLSLLQGIFPAQDSRIAGRFFTCWVTRDALSHVKFNFQVLIFQGTIGLQ